MASTATIVHVISEKVPSPGPASYHTEHQFGTDAQKWTIKNKYPEKKKEPGPGYENVGHFIGQGPAATMHGRPKDRDYTISPGPDYMPKPLGADATGSAFHIKSNVARDPHLGVPGPGAYDVKIPTTSKAYTLKSRTSTRSEIPVGPGPGKYAPDFSKVMPQDNHNKIGEKFKSKKQEVTPGPSDYQVPRDIPKSNITFHVRTERKAKEVTPGPSDYQVKYEETVQQHTIRPRIDIPKKRYDPEIQNIKGDFGNGPKKSLSSRYPERPATASPGPSYVPPAFGSDAHKWSFGQRTTTSRKISTPGPGQYNPDNKSRGKAFTLKGRNYPPDGSIPAGPGVGKYCPEYERVLPQTPDIKIRDRFKEKPPEKGAQYYDTRGNLLKKTGGITIGNRDRLSVLAGNW